MAKLQCNVIIMDSNVQVLTMWYHNKEVLSMQQKNV